MSFFGLSDGSAGLARAERMVGASHGAGGQRGVAPPALGPQGTEQMPLTSLTKGGKCKILYLSDGLRLQRVHSTVRASGLSP